MNLNEINLEELKFDEIGIWPKNLKVTFLIILFIGSLAAGYFITMKEPIDKLTSINRTLKKKKTEFKTSYDQAINLSAYKKQMIEMQGLFKTLLRQLPSSVQIPNLVEELSQKASINGVKFDLVEPGSKVSKGFYAELPIKLEIIGDYHSLGGFVDNVSQLSRIVTLHDFQLAYPEGNRKGGTSGNNELLVMKVDAKTYWSINDDEKDS